MPNKPIAFDIDFDSGSLDIAKTRVEGDTVLLAGRDNYNTGSRLRHDERNIYQYHKTNYGCKLCDGRMPRCCYKIKRMGCQHIQCRQDNCNKW